MRIATKQIKFLHFIQKNKTIKLLTKKIKYLIYNQLIEKKNERHTEKLKNNTYHLMQIFF